MKKIYYVTMKIIPYRDTDLEMIRDAMRQERHFKNDMMSRFATKYFEYGKDIKALDDEIFALTRFDQPYIKAFTNPMLDKKLCIYQTQADLKIAHNHGLGTGDRSIPCYKSSSCLLVQGNQLKFSNKYGDEIREKYKDKDFEVILMIDKSPFGPKVYFKVVLGKPQKSLNLRTTIKNLILGTERRVLQSKLILKNQKLFLLMAVEKELPDPVERTGIVVGVDVGLSVPAACAVNINEFGRCFLGDSRTIKMHRKRTEYKRRALVHQLNTARGGHGVKRKYEAIIKADFSVQGFMRTYNHKIAKAIVQFALSQNADTINMEKLDIKKGERYSSRLLQTWEYKQLQSFVEEKAKDEGIIVKYVNPANTSITCSRCGSSNKEYRVNQKVFLCSRCGYKINADYNAARNISKIE